MGRFVGAARFAEVAALEFEGGPFALSVDFAPIEADAFTVADGAFADDDWFDATFDATFVATFVDTVDDDPFAPTAGDDPFAGDAFTEDPFAGDTAVQQWSPSLVNVVFSCL